MTTIVAITKILPMGQMYIRSETIVDGMKQYHRHVVEPDSDLSKEDQIVKDKALEVHTQSVKDAWDTFKASAV